MISLLSKIPATDEIFLIDFADRSCIAGAKMVTDLETPKWVIMLPFSRTPKTFREGVGKS
jgi:hypothetical protein